MKVTMFENKPLTNKKYKERPHISLEKIKTKRPKY